MTLDAIQLRVLGSLIEKEITTPENYPLSLNSLIAACNQRSSRDPVLDLTEDEVRQAVHSLEDLEIVSAVRDARVPKYEHRIRTVLNLRRDETAVLCLLLLRGPQTPGELRGRADRMYSFDDIAAVQSTLERLAVRGSTSVSGQGTEQGGKTAQALVVMLPRQPGSRESRFAHLLGGPVAAEQEVRSFAVPAEHPGLAATAVEARRLEVEIEARLEARYAARFEAVEDSLRRLEARTDALERLKTAAPSALETPPAGL